MSTALTTIFGTEIKVYAQPRLSDIQYVGLTGAHGLLRMHLGTRGRPIVITGKLASSGASYSAARQNLQNVIDTIETYTYPGVEPTDYSYEGETYTNTVIDKLQLIPQSDGKVFNWTADGYVTADFVCTLRQLI